MWRSVMKKKRLFLQVAVESLLLFLIVCWTSGYHFVLAGIVEGLSFMVFTWNSCRKFQEKSSENNITLIVAAIIFGRIILEIPIRTFDWSSAVISLPVTIISIIAICFGALCYYKKSINYWIFCASIIVSLSSLVYSLNESLHFL